MVRLYPAGVRQFRGQLPVIHAHIRRVLHQPRQDRLFLRAAPPHRAPFQRNPRHHFRNNRASRVARAFRPRLALNQFEESPDSVGLLPLLLSKRGNKLLLPLDDPFVLASAPCAFLRCRSSATR